MIFRSTGFVAVYGGCCVLALAIVIGGWKQDARTLTTVFGTIYLLFLLYFLLAFFLYAALFAGLAAMVKRQEEVQGAIMLPQMLMLSGYLLFFLAVSSPPAVGAI